MRKLPPLLSLLILICACSRSEANEVSPRDGKSVSASALDTTNFGPSLEVGLNLSTINLWDQNRPFRNLIYGSSWQLQSPSGSYEAAPVTSLDANGWVKSVPAGYRVARGLSLPIAGGAFACRFDGTGNINLEGAAVSNLIRAPGITTFTLDAAAYPHAHSVLLTYKLDSADYIRNIDCREIGTAKLDALAPEFLSQLAGFKVLRFLNWQTATPANTVISWSTRNKPGDADYLQRDGVPLEVIVEAANEADADPWITVPWNADEDYVLRSATYVRDNLAPGRRVYVEVSNEVWNGSYPVSAQACAEAKSEGLPGVNGGQGCALERYAEKTKQVMRVWSGVFAGQMTRLVRIAAFNHRATYWSEAMLGYDKLYESVDALATAPYFGNEISDTLDADQIFSVLNKSVDESVAAGVQQKAIARKYGLRYVAYEGGQHVVLPSNVPLLEQVERDPRMYGVYKQYLAAWRDRVGDNLNLYNHVGSISQYGAWGLSEYAGQPASEAPKLRAVREFLGVRSSSPPIIQSPVQVSLNNFG